MPSVSVWLPDEQRAELESVADLLAEDRSTTIRNGLSDLRIRVGVEQAVVESRLLETLLDAIVDDRADESLDADPTIGLVIDDRHLRTIADGLGATVTETFGTVIRAASEDKYLKMTQAKRIVRRIDSHGLHLTGELRAQAIGDL
ncbi:hypothetical protein [Halorhabdus rudnickae]|uniref:hypothetical protein n=1 Tax=Halorhabdus rudnickae TaxID=1775544 RepID=UPI0010842141|nr:hypothetical protein [Halorhabdus rudnickae]